jgi:methylamine--corrinoid protein Co-methyltransferase
VNTLLATYKEQIPGAPVGEPFQALYDVRKAVPKPEYLDRYSRIKEELGGMGVDFLF